MSYAGRTVRDCRRVGVHAARQCAWTGSDILRESNSAGSWLKVAMAILTISWRADRGGGGATIVMTGCGCISARKVERRSSRGRSADERGGGAAARNDVDDFVVVRRL